MTGWGWAANAGRLYIHVYVYAHGRTEVQSLLHTDGGPRPAANVLARCSRKLSDLLVTATGVAQFHVYDEPIRNPTEMAVDASK